MLRRTLSREGKNLVITVTPIHFHADVKDKAHHGFLNILTRSLDPADVDKLVDTYGVLPGEFMSSVFSMMTPMRSLTKYNVDLIDVVDDEAKFMNFLRMEKWLADSPHHPGEAAKQWLKDSIRRIVWSMAASLSRPAGGPKVQNRPRPQRVCAGPSHYSPGLLACPGRVHRQQGLH